MREFKDDMRRYYSMFRSECLEKAIPDAEREARLRIISGIERYHKECPEVHPSLLKSRLQELISENFIPKIFSGSPFFFEMGMRPAECWGTPGSTFSQPSSWMRNTFLPQFTDNQESRNFYSLFLPNPDASIRLWSGGRFGFDEDHHCLGYSKLMGGGINGLLREIQERRARVAGDDERDELDAMRRGCHAVLRVAERFRMRAEEMLTDERDEEKRRNLGMIVAAAFMKGSPCFHFFARWWPRSRASAYRSSGIPTAS